MDTYLQWKYRNVYRFSHIPTINLAEEVINVCRETEIHLSIFIGNRGRSTSENAVWACLCDLACSLHALFAHLCTIQRDQSALAHLTRAPTQVH